MPSHQIPKSMSEAIAMMVSPYLKRKPNADEIAVAIESIRHPLISVRELAADRRISRQAMVHRLKVAGVKPKGKRGNELLYNVIDVHEI